MSAEEATARRDGVVMELEHAARERDDELMHVADVMSHFATCTGAKVGAVLARGSQAIGSGQNGPPEGQSPCDHGNDICGLSTHAEVVALGLAARWGHRTDGATLYCTHAPCHHCAGLIITTGIREVVYGQDRARSTGKGLGMLRSAGVLVRRHIPASPPLRDENERLRAEVEQHRATVTTGGPPPAVDTEWANATLPPPDSALDETAPPIRSERGSHRLAPEQLAVPDPDRRLTLDESMAVIGERYGNAIDELGRS